MSTPELRPQTPDYTIPGTIPPSYSTVLQNTAADIAISYGPGGTSANRPRDSVFYSPVYEGLRTDTPALDMPQTAIASSQQQIANALAQTLVSMTIATLTPQIQTSKDTREGTSSLQEALAFVRLATTMENEEEPVMPSDGAASPPAPTTASTEIYSAKVDQPPQTGPLGPTPQEITPAPTIQAKTFDAWADEISALFFKPIPQIEKNTTVLLNKLRSTKSQDIVSTLTEFAQLEKLTLTSAEKKEIDQMLQKLGHLFVSANKNGGFVFMNQKIATPFIIQNVLRNMLNMPYTPPEHPVTQATDLEHPLRSNMDLVIDHLSENLADIQMKTLTTEPEPNSDFTTLNSTSVSNLTTLLTTLLTNSGIFQKLPEGTTEAELKKLLQTLSTTISFKNKAGTNQGLQSTNKKALLKNLEDIFKEMQIPITPFLKETILPTLSEAFSTINTKQMSIQLNSGNAQKIKQAFEELTDIHHTDMPAPQKKVTQDYMRVLTEALIYLAQTRAYISQLDGMLSQELSRAKITGIADQMKLSSTLYSQKITEALRSYESTASQIALSHFLKIFMPIIAIVLAIITLITVIASAGAASGSIIACILLIGAISMAVATIVMETIDLISSIATGKSIWEHLFKMLNLEDEVAKAAIEFGIKGGITVILIIFTLGTALITAVVQACQKTVTETVKQILKEGFKKIFESSLKNIIKTMLFSQLFPVELIMQSITKALKTAMKDETAALVVSMVLTFACMALSMGIMFSPEIVKYFSTSKTAAKQIADQAKNAAKELAKTIPKTAIPSPPPPSQWFQQATQAITNGVGSAVTGASATLSAAEGAIRASATSASLVMKTGSRFSEKLMHYLTKFAAQTLPWARRIQAMLEISSSTIRGVTSLTQAAIQQQIAEITLNTSILEALFEEVTSMKEMGTDELMKKLTEDASIRQGEWSRLLNLVSEFIQSASRTTSQLHERAGGA